VKLLKDGNNGMKPMMLSVSVWWISGVVTVRC